MESQNDGDISETGSRKRKKTGFNCLKDRQERIEAQLNQQKVENVVLQRMLEESKGIVEDLTKQLSETLVSFEEQNSNLQQLTDELRIRNSRVMELESDLFFMAGDLDEKSIVEEDLREMCKQLKKKVEKLEAEKRNDKKLKDKYYKTKVRVLKAFEWEENTADPVLLLAVIEFWHAFAQRRTEDDDSEAKQRFTEKDVLKAWKEVTLNGWAGKMRVELQKEFIRSKRYCPIQMARSSDVNCTFNVRAASDIAKCDLSRKKYERGLLPSDQTCRRVMQCVYNGAVQIGFSSFPVQESGNIWCWGDADGRFTNGVNRYVYEVYYKLDPNCELANDGDPWLIPLTGDLTRVSFRGTAVTMCGVKQADARLPSQQEKGKTMNQSPHMYVPALAGYTDEKRMMPYFDEFVAAFREIEKRGYCVVNNEQFSVNIRSFVVGDLAFEQKYLQRGGGSFKTIRFCTMCSNTCHFRHKGYPGGCLKHRQLGKVYDEDTGVQTCLCHDVCTPEFLQWENERFEDLSRRVATRIPMSKMPTWESVGALRSECVKRCVTPQDRQRLNRMTTEAQMQRWLLSKSKRKLMSFFLSDFVPYLPFSFYVEGCTLTLNEAHGIRICPFGLVQADLEERDMDTTGRSQLEQRSMLELVLREEEEWQQMVMYRRDTRFAVDVETGDVKLQLDRTVIDMLHLPMRTNEKVLNLLYEEILNGKTKNEVNGPRKGAKKKKEVVGDAAVGQQVAKMFVNDLGLPDLFRGVVASYNVTGTLELYTVVYEDEDTEDLNLSEFREAHSFAKLLEKDKGTDDARLQKLQKKIVSPRLGELTDILRQLGSLGETWTHQWEEGNSKALKKIKLPFDQSKRIFKVANLVPLQGCVDLAVSEARTEHRADWKIFLEHYTHMIEMLTRSIDFDENDVDALEKRIEKCYTTLVKISGMKGCTNYFHYLGSGHIIWLTKRYGNLWRWRNEGVEGKNSTLSLRYNKFNNRGGNKGNYKDKELQQKCFPFQVLGAWMARLTMWQLGLGEALFVADIGEDVTIIMNDDEESIGEDVTTILNDDEENM